MFLRVTKYRDRFHASNRDNIVFNILPIISVYKLFGEITFEEKEKSLCEV